MLGFRGPAPPSPAIGDALNAGCGYLEVKCLDCNTHQTIALDIIRRPKTIAVHELERLHAMQGLLAGARLSLQTKQLIALRSAKISADNPASEMWPGDRD